MLENFYGRFNLDRPLLTEHQQALQEFCKAIHHEPGVPDRYCHWVPTKDGTGIVWDSGEKFYYFREWIVYLIEHFIKPWGYVASGEVVWAGDYDNLRAGGIIYIRDNQVEIVEDIILNPGPSWNRKDRKWLGDGRYS